MVRLVAGDVIGEFELSWAARGRNHRQLGDNTVVAYPTFKQVLDIASGSPCFASSCSTLLSGGEPQQPSPTAPTPPPET